MTCICIDKKLLEMTFISFYNAFFEPRTFDGRLAIAC